MYKNLQAVTLLFLGILSVTAFLLFRYSLELGLCSNIETFQNGARYCVSTRGAGDYFWTFWHWGRVMTVIGFLAFFIPKKSISLLVLTAISIPITLLAIMSAPDISGNILSPFTKKFVGQLGAGIYFAVALVVWLTALYRSRKMHG
jgi:hypothetical protein